MDLQSTNDAFIQLSDNGLIAKVSVVYFRCLNGQTIFRYVQNYIGTLKKHTKKVDTSQSI